MLVTLLGSSILSNKLQPKKTPGPIVDNWLPVSNVTVARELQSVKALGPILVTLFGISILAKEQPSNASFPIPVTLLGICTYVNEEQLQT